MGTPTTATTGPAKTIPTDAFGVNGGDVKSGINLWNDASFDPALAAIAPATLRYASGTRANTWRWRASATDPTFAGYCEDGAKDSAGVPYKLTLARFKTLCDAAGATPIFDLNMDCDSTVYGSGANGYRATPYGTPNLTDQLAMLAAAASVGLPITYVELGNEFYLANQPEKTTYPNPTQAKNLVDGSGAPLYTNTPGGFPLGFVWDRSAPANPNANGQNEVAMMRGHAVTGYAEAPDVPGSGAAGGGFLYGKRCVAWMAAIRSAHPGVKVAIHAAPGPANLPSLGPPERRYFNAGLMEGLDVVATPANTPDGVVLHTYWGSGLTYTYGSAVPSVDRAKPAGSQANVDVFMASADARWTQVKGFNIGSIPSTSVPGNTGTDPGPFYDISALLTAGAKLWITEFNLLDDVTLQAAPSASFGADATEGGWGHIVQLVAGGLLMMADPSVERAVVHTAVGGTAALASILSTTTAYTSTFATVTGITPRTVTDAVLTTDGTLVSSATALFTAADDGATVTVGSFTTTIVVVNTTTATLAAPATTGGTGLTLKIDPVITYPIYRYAGGATPTSKWERGPVGQGVILLAKAARGATTVKPLAFTGALTVGTTPAAGVLGALFSGPSGKKSALVVNLRPDTLDVTLPSDLATTNYAVFAADPAKVTLAVGDLSTAVSGVTGAGTPVLSIPPYGIVRFDAAQTPGQILGDFTAPVSADAGELVQIPTYAQAQGLAAAAGAAAAAMSVPTTSLSAKGSFVSASAPGVPIEVPQASAPAGAVPQVNPAAASGWSVGKLPAAGLAEAHAGVSSRHSLTGSVTAGNVNTGKLSDTASAWFAAVDATNGAIVTINAVNNTTAGTPPPPGSTYVVSVRNSGTTITLVPGGASPGPALTSGGFIGNQIDYTIAVPDGAGMVFDASLGLYVPKKTGSSLLTAKGDLLVGSATAGSPVRFPAPLVTGQILQTVDAFGTLGWGSTPPPVNGNYIPTDFGYSAWNYTPEQASTSAVMVAGTLYVHRVKAENATAVAALYVGLTSTAFSGASGLFVAVFSADGATRHLVSTDQIAVFVSGTAARARLPFSSSLALTPGAHYYAAILCTSATTAPTLQRTATGLLTAIINAGLPAGGNLIASFGGQGSMPTTINPGSGGSSVGPWMALGA